MDSARQNSSVDTPIIPKHWLWSNFPSPVAKALGGSIGGVVEACCLQPIDVVKTRLQLDHSGKYQGIRHCMQTVMREEGTRALWKGLTPFATHLFCKYAVRFGSNALFEDLFRSTDGKLSAVGRLGGGLGAGVVEALLIVTPFEVIKISLQKQKGLAKEHLKYKGPVHAAGVIVREEGILGLWKGATPTVMRNGTNQMSLFFMKPLFDQILWDVHDGDGKRLETWQSFISGLLGASLGPCLTGPFDVVKTRLMAQEKTGTQHYRGFYHALITIPREEGIRALWKGLLPRLMRIPPGQAIVWMLEHYDRGPDVEMSIIVPFEWRTSQRDESTKRRRKSIYTAMSIQAGASQGHSDEDDTFNGNLWNGGVKYEVDHFLAGQEKPRQTRGDTKDLREREELVDFDFFNDFTDDFDEEDMKPAPTRS